MRKALIFNRIASSNLGIRVIKRMLRVGPSADEATAAGTDAAVRQTSWRQREHGNTPLLSIMRQGQHMDDRIFQVT